jgi:hypothetical protein
MIRKGSSLVREYQDTERRGYQMAVRSMTTQEAAPVKPHNTAVGNEKPQIIIATYIGPTCEHAWSKLAIDLQTLEAEGKTIWKCRTCEEITSTYDWQTP